MPSARIPWRHAEGEIELKQELMHKGRETIARGMGWLSCHEAETAQIDDLSAHYKAPYLYAVTGEPVRGAHYASLMQDRYQQPDGDFRTAPDHKGWTHLPISPANRYVYSNGWIIMGLRKLGLYGMATRGADFLLRFRSPELGGFASRFDVSSRTVDPRYLDSSSTASAGLALLACGRIEPAMSAGDFILRLLDAQPTPDRAYYCSWETGRGLLTDVWTDEDKSALRGRKQFCLSAEHDPLQELTWLIGKPMKFLSVLYEQTGQRKYLQGAATLFDFFHKLGEERWHNYASCKIMWASAGLHRQTGEQKYRDTAERIFEWFCDSMDESGLWVHGLWYRTPAEQPLAGSLDLVQELCAEMSDVMFDLGMTAAQSS
jgi:hypothetical protein